MKINSINNVNFGKKAIFNCTVKRADTKEKENATLYLYNQNNLSDMAEVRKFNNHTYVERCFLDPRNDYSKYYFLVNDDTKEVISSAKTTEFFAKDGKYEGRYTSIDEIAANPKYMDSMMPTLAQVAKEAINRFSNNVITAFRADEAPSLKSSKFTLNKDEVWFLPDRRYNILIETAEKRNQIEYIE